MGFVGFLKRVLLTVLGGGVFLISIFVMQNLLFQGQTAAAAIVGIIGLVGALFAVYQREKQPSEI